VLSSLKSFLETGKALDVASCGSAKHAKKGAAAASAGS
jgi:hypothetical protein